MVKAKKVSDVRKLYEVDDDPSTIDNRFNDGKCDPSGRLWAGTMGGEPVNGQVKREKGSLFSFQNNRTKTHLSKVGISNGLAWSTELNKFYYIDSHRGTVDEYDFDIQKGSICVPDGMAIDTDGNLWVAVFNGNRVIKIDPRKPETLLETIPIPAQQVTSVAFGGLNLDEIYVTTAKFTIDGNVLPPPNHGGTYKITGTNAKGFPGVDRFTESMSKIEILPISQPLDVGTRIHWDEETQSLYYVDVPNSMVYKYDVNTGETTHAKVGNEPLAFMFPVEGSNIRFIAGLGRKFVFVEWDGVSIDVSKIEIIVEIDKEANLKENRLNGAKVDPYGTLWAGSMGPSDAEGNITPGKGSLYSLCKGVLKKHDSNIGCSNGLAWNIKEEKLYHVDTLVPAVFQYDISKDGKLSNKVKVFDFKQNNVKGQPDGLTIDSNGALWVCCIFGSCIVKFDPKDGKVLRTIKMPTTEVTSVTFGGKNLDKMYVTTARIPKKGLKLEESAGTTYVVYNTGATGCPGNRYVP
ncbi:hypothetical protein NQ315_008175 [Exocentrus adspersus]|uniref:SMP-30/Gluconolactonase/LRE-like region domain-containing protein n=1 Tax=Exocentrus adspersus TaxID=1586481 RepID=A0AAV8VVW1_9CUCU|nr:hypothetical protein NQ315_008175 [Exocentrus adspersus]